MARFIDAGCWEQKFDELDDALTFYRLCAKSYIVQDKLTLHTIIDVPANGVPVNKYVVRFQSKHLSAAEGLEKARMALQKFVDGELERIRGALPKVGEARKLRFTADAKCLSSAISDYVFVPKNLTTNDLEQLCRQVCNKWLRAEDYEDDPDTWTQLGFGYIDEEGQKVDV